MAEVKVAPLPNILRQSDIQIQRIWKMQRHLAFYRVNIGVASQQLTTAPKAVNTIFVNDNVTANNSAEFSTESAAAPTASLPGDEQAEGDKTAQESAPKIDTILYRDSEQITDIDTDNEMSQAVSHISVSKSAPTYADAAAKGSLIVAIIDQCAEDTLSYLDQYKLSKLRSIISARVLG